MGDQCSLINDLRGGDHHKRTTVLAGVSHDERCLEAADEIERLRAALREAGDVIECYHKNTGIDLGAASRMPFYSDTMAKIDKALEAGQPD